MEPPALASTGAAERLSLQHQVTLSALWLGLNFQSSALLPIVVPAQVLLLVDRGAVASSNQALAVSVISFGAGGYGAYLRVDWALAIDLLPGRASSARDRGIFTVSINLPRLIAPALGGVVIVLANVAGVGSIAYRLVFSLAAISLLLGVIVIRRLEAA